jgi:hypothetical protein
MTNPLAHLVDAVADVQRRRATEPLVYRVVRRGKPTSANWTTELDSIPAELVAQARAVATQGNREAGFSAYDVWSW